jgi:hypothetical protein
MLLHKCVVWLCHFPTNIGSGMYNCVATVLTLENGEMKLFLLCHFQLSMTARNLSHTDICTVIDF